MTESYKTSLAKSLRGEITISPDKSISHRSLIFAALAEGTSEIKNLLLGEDVLCTLECLNRLGVKTSHTKTTLKKGDTLVVEGVGLKGLKTPGDVLYCGNSGTAMRLLLGLVCGAGLEASFTGDHSLNKRPMERVTGPLAQMGGRFSTEFKNGERYIRTHAHSGLKAIRYDSPVASAQVKTALVLAALNGAGETIVTEPELSRNHTEIMLTALGANVMSEDTTLRVGPTKKLHAFKMTVPGDISSAAFFIVGALITPDSDVLIRRVNLNPTRTGILDALMAMGADIQILARSEEGGEAVGDLRVRTSQLKNTDVGGAIIPRLIDEIPILALAAASASGTMTLSDAKELRVKETDRIRAVCHELANLGADITERPDGFVVTGGKSLQPQTASFSSYGDHRMAMTLIMAGLNLGQPIAIDDVACINTSFPEFFELLKSLMK